jgi:hypothetical protein
MTFEPTGAAPRMLVPVTVTVSTSGTAFWALAWSVRDIPIKRARLDPLSMSFCESAFMKIPPGLLIFLFAINVAIDRVRHSADHSAM